MEKKQYLKDIISKNFPKLTTTNSKPQRLMNDKNKKNEKKPTAG